MYFGIPQIIMTALLCLSLGTHLAAHGKPRTGTYSFWTALFSFIVEVFLLYKGGFYG